MTKELEWKLELVNKYKYYYIKIFGPASWSPGGGQGLAPAHLLVHSGKRINETMLANVEQLGATVEAGHGCEKYVKILLGTEPAGLTGRIV